MKWTLLGLFLLFPIFLLGDGARPSTHDLPNLSLPKSEAPIELNRLNFLIEATQRSLENQLQLKKDIGEYLLLQEEYAKNNDNIQLSMKMILKAWEIYQTVQKFHLEYLFDPQFIKELEFFSEVAEKQNLVKP